VRRRAWRACSGSWCKYQTPPGPTPLHTPAFQHKVAFEGLTHLIPYAARHETIRQRRRDLTLARMTPDDLLYDQLIGAMADWL
jgi:hypothetical protein